MLVHTRHVDTVRRAFHLFETGEVDPLVMLYHPQVEILDVGALGTPVASYVGVERARTYLRGLVEDGLNCVVDELELVEVDGNVLAAGRITEPTTTLMRWRFDFEGDLIKRVEPLDPVEWAQLDDRGFMLAQVLAEPERGTVQLRLSDGRAVAAPIAEELVACTARRSPVFAFFDGQELTGWYLPDHQRGMVLG